MTPNEVKIAAAGLIYVVKEVAEEGDSGELSQTLLEGWDNMVYNATEIRNAFKAGMEKGRDD